MKKQYEITYRKSYEVRGTIILREGMRVKVKISDPDQVDRVVRGKITHIFNQGDSLILNDNIPCRVEEISEYLGDDIVWEEQEGSQPEKVMIENISFYRPGCDLTPPEDPSWKSPKKKKSQKKKSRSFRNSPFTEQEITERLNRENEKVREEEEKNVMSYRDSPLTDQEITEMLNKEMMDEEKRKEEKYKKFKQFEEKIEMDRIKQLGGHPYPSIRNKDYEG